MKEFFYTSCPTGKRADDRRPTAGGFGARAISAGLGKAQLDVALAVAGCEFPRAARPPADASIARLAWLKLRDGQLVLLRSVPGGRDEVGRTGIPFTHAILELPGDFGASEAIRTWGSSDWRERYDDEPLDLDGPVRPPSGGCLDADGLQRFLDDGRNRAMTTYAIAAHLALPPAGKIFLYARPEQVAWVVLALTLALPRPLQSDLTFSTYEHGVLNAPARIVGNWGSTRENDLPRACYDRPNAAFHAEAGRTGMTFDSPYAGVAVDWLATGDAAGRRRFLDLCEAMHAADAGALEDLAALEHARDHLGPERVRRLLAHPPISDRAARAPAVCDAVLGRALAGDGQDGDLFALLVRAAPSADARAAITGRVDRAVMEQATAGRPDDVLRLINLLRQADEGRSRRLGNVLFEGLEPGGLSWPVRKALLPLLRDGLAGDHRSPPRELGPWLEVDAGQLPELLALKLPEAWEDRGWAAAARRAPIEDATLLGWLADRPQRLVAVSRLLGAEGGGTAAPEAQLAGAFRLAKPDALLRAFEQAGGPVPPAVCDRILADRDAVRSLLGGSAAVRARLRDRAAALAQVVTWAIERQDARHLLEERVRRELGDGLPEAFAEAGWVALGQGKVQDAKFALEGVWPKLAPADRDGAWMRMRQIEIGAFPAAAQEYLVERLLAARDVKTLDGWVPRLAHEILSSLLTRGEAPEPTRKAAFQRYCLARPGLPDQVGRLAFPPALVVELLRWLIDHAGRLGRDAAPGLLKAQLQDRRDVAARLREAVAERAEDDPDFWPLADLGLGDGLGSNSSPRDPSVIRIAQSIVKYYGCTPNVQKLAETLLDTAGGHRLDGPAWGFLEAIEAAQGRRGLTGGMPRRELLEFIQYQRLCEQQGEDMGLSQGAWEKIPLLGDLFREKRIREQLWKLGDDFLALSRDPANDLAGWLDQQLNKMTGSGHPLTRIVHGKAEALERLLAGIQESGDQAGRFWPNSRAVAAFFGVGLGVPAAIAARGRHGFRVAVVAPDEAMDRVLQGLADEVRRRNQDEFFLDVARATSDWPDELYDRWKAYHRGAGEDRRGHSGAGRGKPGLLGAWLSKGKDRP